jgi:hypothetical protein
MRYTTPRITSTVKAGYVIHGSKHIPLGDSEGNMPTASSAYESDE